MSDRLLVKNGQVALPGEEALRFVDIAVEDGKIAGIGRGLSADGEVIDAGGLWVLPGGIDAHVHFDDPGYTDREDFLAGSSAAASGGITTVIDMPCTSVPPVTNVSNMREKLAVIEAKSVVDFGLYAGVCEQSFTGDWEADMVELADYVLGFKAYLTSGMQSFQRLDHYRLQQVLKVATRLGLPVLLHAEDFSYVDTATRIAREHGNRPRDYYESRPEIAETLAVSAALELADSVGGDLHIVHLATGAAAALLRGRRASGETAAHYLQFTEEDFERIGSALKVAPAVKAPGNREVLWDLLAAGVIDFIASDHAPSPEAEKHTGSIWTDYGGIPGVGTSLPYMISEGFMTGRLSLSRLLEVTSSAAAHRYGLFDKKGAITIGKDADLVLFDPTGAWTVDGHKFLSKGKVTPFEGMRLKGKIAATLLRGRKIYDSDTGICVAGGYGKWLPRFHA